MIYEIPVKKRFIGDEFSRYHDCIEVDGFGIFMHADTKDKLTEKFSRHCLRGIIDKTCLIEADTPHEAINKFHNEQHGANIGGPFRKSKAIWIDETRRILEFPPCKHLHKAANGDLVCGPPQKDGSGEFGYCVLEGFDAPDFDCPIDSFYGDVTSAETLENMTIESISGFDVVRVTPV